jgi:LuxR family transcriptional regulator, activator of tox operons
MGRATATVAARVIAAIGRSDFPERLLAVCRELAGCELCSAFSWEPRRGPRLLLAAGSIADIPQFALAASRAYTDIYWRRDAVVQRNWVRGSNSSHVLRMTAADIRDPDYRHDCYQVAHISERLMLFDTESPAVSVSGYRAVGRSPTTFQMAQRLEDAGPTLIAAIRRHTELMERREQTVLTHSRSVLLRRAREWGLSEREAEVAAGLVMGQSQSDIAKASGLALNSVITYRRRAYQKLKIADRLELRAMCDRLIPLAEP